MNFLKIAGRDIKSIFTNRVIRVSVIAIIVVPLLYSLLYLDAFWDPYSKLESLPIAVVNLDKGATLDGKSVNYGNDIIDKLKGNSTVGWHFVSEDEADQGLDGSKYYAKFEIESDFSEKVISAKSGTPVQASMKFVCNEKKNFLAAQVNSKVQSALKEQIVSTITDNYVTATFDNLYQVKDGMASAADGSSQINNGVSTLNSNVPTLVDGVSQLKDGSSKLYDGQTQLNTGLTSLNNGLGQLNGQVPTLVSGVNSLYAGSTQLSNGASSANAGSKSLADGTKQLTDSYNTLISPSVTALYNGSNQLKQGLDSSKSDIAKLQTGVTTLTSDSDKVANGSANILSGYTSYKAGVDQLITSTNSATTAMESIGQLVLQADLETDTTKKNEYLSQALIALQKLQIANNGADQKLAALTKGGNDLFEGITTYNNSVPTYTQGVKDFASGTNSLISGTNQVSAGVDQLNAGLASLNTGLTTKFGPGLEQANSGASALNSGLSDIAKGAGDLNTGLGTLNSSTPQLANGISALYSGSGQALTGANQLVTGQKQLYDGVNTLYSKVPDLQTGVSKLYDGTKELSSKLGDGSKQLNDGLVNTSADMGSFVSNPVSLLIEPINAVPNYGTGFAPYFMNLSLWIGAIMMFFVIPAKVDEDIKTSNLSKTIGKYISFAVVGVLQAILVGVVVMLLGLRPTNVATYFGLLTLYSLVYVAIVQCLITLLGDPGRLLSIVLLILQLTACAGTFPLELVPGFFKTLYPFMPFTYAVEALREACSATTLNHAIVIKDSIILTLIMIAFLAISIKFRTQGLKFQEIMEGRKSQR